MGLTEVKGKEFKDTSIRKILAKKHKIDGQALQKMANIIFLIKIRIFEEEKKEF